MLNQSSGYARRGRRDLARGYNVGVSVRDKILGDAAVGYYPEKIPNIIPWADYIRKNSSLQVVRSEKTRVKSELGGLLATKHFAILYHDE
jgi:hypothetical protein